MKTLVIASESPARTWLCEALGRRGHVAVVVEDAAMASAAYQAGPYELVWVEVSTAQRETMDLIRCLHAGCADRPSLIVAWGRQIPAELVGELLAAGADDCLCLTAAVDESLLNVRLAVLEARLRQGAHDRAPAVVAQPQAGQLPAPPKSGHIGEASYRLIAEHIGDMVWMCHAEGLEDLPGELSTEAATRHAECFVNQWRFSFVSPSVERILGYRSEEFKALTTRAFLSAEGHRDVVRLLAEELLTVRQNADPWRRRSLELQHIDKQGRTRWCELTCTWIRDERKRIVGVLGICRDIDEQRQSREAIRREQDLLRKLLEMHERDRQVLAFELHDGFAQQLSGAMFNLQAFRQLHGHASETAWKAFDAGMQLIGQSIEESRRLVSGLCPPVLEEFGIIPAIENLVAAKSDAGRPEIELVCRGHVPRLARPLENAVFRIVQETLANACRYSESDRVRVELSRNERELHLSVQDWGVGFEPHRVGDDRFGLRGVTERARLLGGSAKIESAAGKGTHIRVTLPLVVSADDDRHRLEETLEAKRRRGDVEE